MTDTNLFLLAARQKYRFKSAKGELTVEQLLDLPLVSRTSATSLDDVARAINADIQLAGKESFVEDVSPAVGLLTNKLELVKAVIKIKQDEAMAKQDGLAKAQKRAQLQELIDKKGQQALEDLSVEELTKQLNAL